MGKKQLAASFCLIVIFLVAGCGSNNKLFSATEDTSSSGSVAAVIGGGVNGTSNFGYQSYLHERPAKIKRMVDAFQNLNFLPLAYAGNKCPTATSGTTDCSGSGTATLTYTFDSCSFGTSPSVWNGSQTLTLSTGTATCGTFPATGSYTGTLQRQFGANTTRVAASGTTVSIDTTGSETAGNGITYSGGMTVTFSSGDRTNIAIGGMNLTSEGKFNHSITTAGTPSGVLFNETTKTVSGELFIFHNLARVMGTSTINATFTPNCCLPTSGAITTSFSAISGHAALLSGFVGRSEILTFTGCGTAVLEAVDGSSSEVTLAHCF